MNTLNIFTVEKLIFLNPKAKKVLWKEFSNFFKEYIFLKQAGVDSALFSKLYMKFFEQFSNKNHELYLNEIFGKGNTTFNINFKKSSINVECDIANIDNNSNIHEILYSYPNIVCSRNKENLKITFWK